MTQQIYHQIQVNGQPEPLATFTSKPCFAPRVWRPRHGVAVALNGK